MEEIIVKSWEEFSPFINSIREKYGKRYIASSVEQNRIVFRGHSNADWKLQSTLERFSKEDWTLRSYAKLALRCAPQIESFTNKNWKLPTWLELEKKLGESFDPSLLFEIPCYDFWVYIRHHGFPSPLLDWSLSPYVAAFFAFYSHSPSKQSAIFAYIETPKGFKIGGVGEPSIRVLGPYTRSHQRHFLQQAHYSICTQVKENNLQFICHEKVFENPEPVEQDTLIKIVIPRSERMKVLAYLNEYNINEFSLFQTEDALIKTMAYKEIEMRENL